MSEPTALSVTGARHREPQVLPVTRARSHATTFHRCEQCGVGFEARSDARYCSGRCRVAAHRQAKTVPERDCRVYLTGAEFETMEADLRTVKRVIARGPNRRITDDELAAMERIAALLRRLVRSGAVARM